MLNVEQDQNKRMVTKPTTITNTMKPPHVDEELEDVVDQDVDVSQEEDHIMNQDMDPEENMNKASKKWTTTHIINRNIMTTDIKNMTMTMKEEWTTMKELRIHKTHIINLLMIRLFKVSNQSDSTTEEKKNFKTM